MPRREKNTSPWDITPEVISEIKNLISQGYSKKRLAMHYQRAEFRISKLLAKHNILTYYERAAETSPPMTRDEFIDMQEKWGCDSTIARFLKVPRKSIIAWREVLSLERVSGLGKSTKCTPKTVTLTENEIAKLFNGQRYQDMRKKSERCLF